MDFLKVAVIIAFVILTIFTIKMPPSMHQPMLIEDSDFVLTRISDTITTDNIPVANVSNTQQVKKTEIPLGEQIQSTKKAIEVYNKTQEQPIVKYVQPQENKVTKKEIRVQEQPISEKTSQIELLQRVLKNSENEQVAKQPKETKITKTAKVDEPKATQPKTVQTPPKHEPVQQKTVQTTKPKSNTNPYMTAEEEIIAWNIWRSNIQNQIMRDSNIDYAPLGTIFSFSFVVDKFGNISNVKVECSHPSFMDVARNNVKPAIMRMQKKPILNFPRGTQRTSTVVTGLFLIGTQERYSTPDNYSDYERVVR